MIVSALLMITAPVVKLDRKTYECQAKTDDSGGNIRISFVIPSQVRETIAETRLAKVKVDDPQDVVSYLTRQKIKGRITHTGVIEIFSDIGIGRAWLRMIPDFSSGRYNLTGMYLYMGHPVISGDTVGECTEVPMPSPR